MARREVKYVNGNDGGSRLEIPSLAWGKRCHVSSGERKSAVGVLGARRDSRQLVCRNTMGFRTVPGVKGCGSARI